MPPHKSHDKEVYHTGPVKTTVHFCIGRKIVSGAFSAKRLGQEIGIFAYKRFTSGGQGGKMLMTV